MTKRAMRVTIAAVMVTIGLCLPFAANGSATVSVPRAAKPALVVKVSGHHLVNASGERVRLLGFNNSGAEYACMQGWGIFDDKVAPYTSIPASHVAAMAKWTGANAVRISLNEQCWLGLANVPPQYAKANYRAAIVHYVQTLNTHGFAVILDLHNSAPGSESSLNQEPMPDAHSIPFWHQVATTFKTNRSVLFDVFNEPFPDFEAVSTATWRCWRDGGCMEHSTNGSSKYRAVGMDQLIHAVRSAGARNVILAGGLNYASSLTSWMRFEPRDPDHQLAASLHVYSFGGCHTVHCYNGSPATVAAHVPLVLGEIGADLTQGQTCNSLSDSGTTGFDKALFHWADRHDASWLAWTWNPWPDNCLDLITNYNGTPTSPYGTRIRAELKAHRHLHPV